MLGSPKKKPTLDRSVHSTEAEGDGAGVSEILLAFARTEYKYVCVDVCLENQSSFFEYWASTVDSLPFLNGSRYDQIGDPYHRLDILPFQYLVIFMIAADAIIPQTINSCNH